MAKIVGISQFQGEEEAGFTGLMGCQWVRCWENRNGQIGEVQYGTRTKGSGGNETVTSEMTASIKFVVEN